MAVGVITINLDPRLHLGPLTVAWHGLMIAAGIAIGGFVASRFADRRGLDRDRLWTAVGVIALAGIVGSKLFYLLLNPADLARPERWLSGYGFAFYGAMIGGTVAVAVYLRRARLGIAYLDALAFGFPLGLAVGRIGDLISGEHYGPPSDAPWAVRYLNPSAEVPHTGVAYHSGALYEIVLGLVMLLVVWLLAKRLRRPGALLWAVIALYSAGRFVIFFYRDDSSQLALGLNAAQWTSLGLIAAAALGAWWSGRAGHLGRLRART